MNERERESERERERECLQAARVDNLLYLSFSLKCVDEQMDEVLQSSFESSSLEGQSW